MTEQTAKFIDSILSKESEAAAKKFDYITGIIKESASLCNQPGRDAAEKAYQAGRLSAAMQILREMNYVVFHDKIGWAGDSDLHIQSVSVNGEEIFHD